MTRLTCFLTLLLFASGCGRSTTPVTSLPTSPVPTSNGDADNVTSAPPKYAPVEVFINNHEFGDQNGCTTTFSPQPRSQTTKIVHGSTCGHPGAVSKLTWEYVRTDQAGDHYTVERVFPNDEPNQRTTTTEVAYTGQELLLFEDDVQRIVMRPGSRNTQ